jgi:hypothetical protein
MPSAWARPPGLVLKVSPGFVAHGKGQLNLKCLGRQVLSSFPLITSGPFWPDACQQEINLSRGLGGRMGCCWNVQNWGRNKLSGWPIFRIDTALSSLKGQRSTWMVTDPCQCVQIQPCSEASMIGVQVRNCL